ncbi:MAG: hypothetical protein JO257_07720 [Deltaproteobacteria bacterium]|nr:hypothetical protein [Deltaproteobacteria bacterium]
MSDLRLSFAAMETAEGQATLDARSFRQAARLRALASGRVPRHTLQEPVYIVAPAAPRRWWVVPALVGASAASAGAALLVWLS